MKRKFKVLKDWLCYKAGDILETDMSGELCVVDKGHETIVYLWNHDEVKEVFNSPRNLNNLPNFKTLDDI